MVHMVLVQNSSCHHDMNALVHQEPAIWNYLTELLAKRDQLLPHLVEDVEGWHLPAIL